MSSGLGGISSASSDPDRMACTSAACSNRSSRVVAKKRPFGVAPRQWPARPTRCMAAATARVEFSWMTKSTAPMSMPSSSDAVATSAWISPAFRRCSASSRSARDSDPWCAATLSGPNRSASAPHSRSVMRRVFTNTSVDLCSRHSCAMRSKTSTHILESHTLDSSDDEISTARSSVRR